MKTTYAFTPSTLRRGPKPKRYQVRVVDDGEVLTDWIDATRATHDLFVLGQHPVFGKAVMNKRELEVRTL